MQREIQPDYWHPPFFGRSGELKQLMTCWETVKNGYPQFAVLLGDTGAGKTRIIQEFYKWLSENEDPNDYWPDRLLFSGSSLSINADPSDSPAAMPWLWWGIRFSNPSTHNLPETSTFGLVSALSLLEPHIAKTEIKLGRKDRFIEASKEVSSAAANLTSGGIIGAIKDIIDLSKTLSSGIRAEHELDLSPQELQQNRINEFIDRLTLAFSGLLNQSIKNKALGLDTVPVIIVIDDAQWADPLTCTFIKALYIKAEVNKWPLLILATHWLSEWHEDVQNSDSTNSKTFAQICKQLAPSLPLTWEPINLHSLHHSNMLNILKDALPGLSDPSRKMILARASGNPGFLYELITYLLSEQAFFENSSFDKDLNSDGLTEIQAVSNLDHFQLAIRRVNRLKSNNPVVASAIQIASLLGNQFIDELVVEIGEMLGMETKQIRQAIEQASNPFHLIKKEEQTSTFYQISIWEAARQSAKQVSSLHEKMKAAIFFRVGKWYEEQTLESYPLTVQFNCLTTLVSLEQKAETIDQRILVGHAYFGLANLNNELDNIVMELANLTIGIGVLKKCKDDCESDNEKEIIESLLERMYSNRAGINNQTGVDPQLVLVDIDKALLSGKQHRKKNENKNTWTEARRNQLAGSYSHRGLLLAKLGDISDALDSYTIAIDVGEELLKLQEDQKTWNENTITDLASYYLNRARTHKLYNNDLQSALSDEDRLLQLREWLKDAIQAQPGLNWSIKQKDELARAYQARSSTKEYLKSKPGNGLDDLNKSIEIRDIIKNELQNTDHWKWEYEVSWSGSLIDRAILHRTMNDAKKALIDLDKAVNALESGFAKRRENGLPIYWYEERELARGYREKASTFNLAIDLGEKHRNNIDTAIKIATKAVDIHSNLRRKLEGINAWNFDLRRDLMGALYTRAKLYAMKRISADTAIDMNEAIKIGELSAEVGCSRSCGSGLVKMLEVVYKTRAEMFPQSSTAQNDILNAQKCRESLNKQHFSTGYN